MIYFKYLTHIHLSYIWRKIEMKRILKVILVILMVCSVCATDCQSNDDGLNDYSIQEHHREEPKD